MSRTADTTPAPPAGGPTPPSGHHDTAGRWTVELDGPCRWEDGHLVVEQDGHRWAVQSAGSVSLRGRHVADDGLAAALCAGDRLELVRTGLGIQLVGVAAA